MAAIIADYLNRDPASLDTDWHSTCPVQGLLHWAARGVPEAHRFASAWLESCGKSAKARGGGGGSRTVHAAGVPITTYAGQYGISFPCYEMATQLQDARARQVCLDVARIILHQAGRNHLGMVEHDDESGIWIPDVCYFAAGALMIAYRLDPGRGWVYRDQAVFQLRTSVDTFLVKQTGLAKTILLKDGLGKTYWTRASGWLLWSITGVLRHLPPADPDFGRFLKDLKALADGIARVQDAGGGFRVLLDEPGTPLETTGSAMFALGLHESVRRGWLPASYGETARRAWKFAVTNIGADGAIRNAYTQWAVPAEKRVTEVSNRLLGFVPGFILCAAHEMSLAGTPG